MKTILNSGYFLLIIWLLIGCQSNKPKVAGSEKDLFEEEISDVVVAKNQTDVVFYNLFSPMDLSNIIDNKSSYFNSSFINPINNITKYSDSYKVALNLGVYGADLSYLWAFEQTQQALSYISAIKHLTDKLGIPADFVDFTVSSAENSSNELDSLISLARDAYQATDRYLKGSERENAAALILLGGWVETLYIALNLYKEPNPALAGKIISQKYSLNSLILVIHNYQDDIKMTEYILLLKKLNEAFQKIESKLKPNDIQIDTIKKVISINETSNLQIEPAEFKELLEQVSRIRIHIIE
ncbi:MAG: hypothetical protein WCX31_13650 [Salinivirgaceae bacterium]|jgi:hypothetical protein